jgi:predicted RNA-binding Zn-ribbon protein involved in translation (DUF1610 family)
MALKGQLIELKNLGQYMFLLRIGIVDDALLERDPKLVDDESGEDEDDSLAPEQPMKIYECKLDIHDGDNPVTYPIGELSECVEIYHTNKSPALLSPEDDHKWKTGFIIDAIVSECFATDSLEVIYGDEWETAPIFHDDNNDADTTVAGAAIPSPQALHLGRKNSAPSCPDCGAEVKITVNEPNQNKNAFACHVCGRHFDI